MELVRHIIVFCGFNFSGKSEILEMYNAKQKRKRKTKQKLIAKNSHTHLLSSKNDLLFLAPSLLPFNKKNAIPLV